MHGQTAFASARTQTDAAYAALRDAILSCRLEPGAKIKINDAAAEFDFSPGAVREALSRLAAERMAVATAQKGFTVAAISAEELIDLTRTRISIEQLCLRSAIANGDVEWEADIVRPITVCTARRSVIKTREDIPVPASLRRTMRFMRRWRRPATADGH